MELAEMETTILWDRSSDVATVYTADRRMRRIFDRIVREHPDECSIKHRYETGCIYNMPVSYIHIGAADDRKYAVPQEEAPEFNLSELRSVLVAG